MLKQRIGLQVAFEKADASGRYVRGWASVATVDGKTVEDADGDRIEIEELRTAAHRFITEARVAKMLHRGEPIGEVVESIIVDDAFCKAVGATTAKRGWFIGMEVHAEAVRKRVRAGELLAFSIGGKGKRARADA